MATILSDVSGTPRPSPCADEQDGAGLGDLLRRARERRGVTLEQISNETKIPRRHLEALEHDDLAALPGGFYRRAQVRVFARAVNLDQDLAVSRLERSLGRPAADAPPPDAPAAHRPLSSRHRVLVIIGVGVAAAVFARSIAGRQPVPGHDGPGPRASDSPGPGVPRAPATPAGPLAGTAPPAPSDPVVPPSTGSENAPAAAANSFTELVVTTQPAGARVTVDEIGWGSAPVTIRFLPAGSKRIRVIKEGYRGEERVVSLVDGRRSVLEIQLQSAP